MSNVVIGTCGNCGGAVCTPAVWMGLNPPTPACVSCGAKPQAAHGPVIPMQIAPPNKSVTDVLRELPVIGVINVDNPRDPRHKEWASKL